MTFHDILIHLRDNWHKYGIAFLVINHIIEKIRTFQDNSSWVRKKIRHWIKKKHPITK